MDDDYLSICAELRIALDAIRAEVERQIERQQGIFRGMPARATMPVTDWVSSGAHRDCAQFVSVAWRL